MDTKLIYEEETFAIRGAVFEVYKTLGDGYLEEVYQNALEEELKLRGIPFVAKKELHIMYKGRDCGLYEPDFICFDKIIVELKAVETLHPKHSAAYSSAEIINEYEMTTDSGRQRCLPLL